MLELQGISTTTLRRVEAGHSWSLVAKGSQCHKCCMMFSDKRKAKHKANFCAAERQRLPADAHACLADASRAAPRAQIRQLAQASL